MDRDFRARRASARFQKNWRRILFSETGQLSIFIALIFQVLFVFFAMVVNVGLLVHDKINLQNAVDLAAYYGAERQAEIMNELAHINFQLRQDYKLLAWRYRVMGTLGRQGSNSPTEDTLPPARKSSPGSLSDQAWVNSAYGDEPPSVCVANDAWSDMNFDSPQDENYCFRKYGDTIPKIPDLPQIAPFVPGVAESQSFTQQAQQAQYISCQKAGPLNWAFTMQMIYAYKLAIAARKVMFWELRRNLIDGNFKDRNGEEVKTGVLTTLKKNLTQANQDGFDDGGFQVLNGLADPNCNKGDDGEFILPEIRTVPSLLYTNYHCDDGRDAYMVAHQNFDNLDQAELQNWDASGLMRNLAKGEPEPTSPYHSTLGFEKNPWCMAYVGVHATTSTSKPFAPFGTPIKLQARAFAQPFGGRMGPWYKERWTRGAPTSAEGDRVDPLTSPRLLTGNSLDDATPIARLPNYSRYPGDQLGLKSAMTMGAQNAIIRGYTGAGRLDRLRLKFYTGFDPIPSTGDVLAQNANDPNFPLRKAEIAAVTPDLFDATYYSVDPNYYDAYVAPGPDQSQNLPPIFGHQVKQLPDIGGRLDGNGGGGQANFSVTQQIEGSVNGGLDQQVLPKLYYVIRQWEHLLTGWVQGHVQDFAFPQERFGQCQKPAADSLPIPGKCWQGGGRVGYSVRLISRNHLLFKNWKVGGDGEQEGAILNPPASDF